jgi:hypothetical protein
VHFIYKSAAAPATSTTTTSLHLACSGAKIADHSIARTRNDNNVADGGLLDPYVGVNPADGPVRPSQVDEAKRPVDKREVDAILLSIGVNDLEFGPIILSCAHAGVVHGAGGADCFTVPYTSNAGAMFARMVLFLRFTISGELPGLFKTLNARLVSTFGAPFPKGAFPTDRVFIPDYPATAKKPFSWSSIGIVGPTGQGFATHGYCSTNRWVRQRDESFTPQNSQNGLLHPNEDGHRWIAEAVYTVVHAKLYPGGTARLPVK